MSAVDDNWIAKTIVPKSDQLNAEDLLNGSITVKVLDVKQGAADQPVIIEIDGNRQPYKPCKTMRKVLVNLWSDRASTWIGKRLTLYADPNVKWGGVAVGGIRISHMSDIKEKTVLMLSETRGKRAPVTILPLVSESVLDVYRPHLKGQTKPVLAISKKIADAFNAKDATAFDSIEAEISQIEDAKGNDLLKRFLSDVLKSLTEGGAA